MGYGWDERKRERREERKREREKEGKKERKKEREKGRKGEREKERWLLLFNLVHKRQRGDKDAGTRSDNLALSKSSFLITT